MVSSACHWGTATASWTRTRPTVYYIILHGIILCYNILCYTISYDNTLYYIVVHYTQLYSTVRRALANIGALGHVPCVYLYIFALAMHVGVHLHIEVNRAHVWPSSTQFAGRHPPSCIHHATGDGFVSSICQAAPPPRHPANLSPRGAGHLYCFCQHRHMTYLHIGVLAAYSRASLESVA